MTPDSRRLAKQLTYGIFFCLFWVVIFYGGYKLFWAAPASCFDNKLNQDEEAVDCGGICPDCALKTLKPIQVTIKRPFSLGGVEALFEFQNPNSLYGASKLPYAVQILNASSSVIRSLNEETFIYPGEVKFIIQDLPTEAVGQSINVTFGTPEWKRVADFPSPDMAFMGVSTKQEANKLLVSGDLKSNETLTFPTIIINALFFDGNNNLLGVSKTEIHDVVAHESRFFQIEHPLVPNLDVSKTQYFFEAKRP